MEWSKIKNIIILILLAVNVFLLVQVAQRERQSRQYLEESRSGAVEVLRQQGYEVADGALPEESSLIPCTVERDRDGEEALAAYLLGAVHKTDDGVRTAYEGEKGGGWFRSDGSFAFTFTADAYPVTGDEAAHALKLLDGGGYAYEVVSTKIGETTVVSVRQTWEGAPVFSCRAELTYQNGALASIAGTRLIGTPAQDGGGEQSMDVSTALIRFMSGMREEGHVFTKIESLTSGYRATGSGRRMELEPVWQVTTNAGVFLMDGVTGELNIE
ncbi:conserved hypothetical protein [uncultured Eubacteriales bacterium]|uniref:Regulatory protein YycH-like domain-containing protein n=1 Tax=uncultured Eubacteriales bacterium TaxID=172733 RepID=A0A212J1I1_9FIRM|nr:conserved hypothetical protein [uncultured Eubacteriales bacterium]